MSKLNDLIARFCPDGVEYKKFSEVCSLHARVGWHRLTKAEHKNSGDFLLITGTDFTDFYTLDYLHCSYVSKERYLQDPKIQLMNDDILITKDGTLGKVAQVKNLPKPATLNSGVFVVRALNDSLNHRYILHYLMSNHFSAVVNQRKTGSTISHLTQELFSNLLIPVPPLEIQREIVRILDTFTELTAELTAELVARKQQYEYYRDLLLTFDDSKQVEFKKLGEIGKVSMCKRIMKYETSDDGEIPFYKIGTFGKIANAFISRELFEKYRTAYSYPNKGDVLISAAGTIGKAIIYDGNPAYYQDSNIVWLEHDESQVLNKFLYYFYQTQPWRISEGGTISRLYNKNIEQTKIPVLLLEEQERIVKILDRFDKLCNDLSEGLPAEIVARQKQYEYYRDKLLSFGNK